jgi:hypothetical protein
LKGSFCNIFRVSIFVMSAKAEHFVEQLTRHLLDVMYQLSEKNHVDAAPTARAVRPPRGGVGLGLQTWVTCVDSLRSFLRGRELQLGSSVQLVVCCSALIGRKRKRERLWSESIFGATLKLFNSNI